MSDVSFKKDPNKGEGIYTIAPEKICQSTLALTSEKPPKKQNQEIEEETLCGFGSWTPSWLQIAADPKLFLFFYSMAGLCQGAQFTYLVGCLSTLEKRFSYDSKSSGIIMIADEIVPIVFGALVGYFGSAVHRPRLVSMGLFVGSISSCMMAVPYFLYGAGHIETSSGLAKAYGVSAKFCEPGLKNTDVCDNSTTWPAVSILFFGNFLKGVAGLIFYSIGTAYLDDSVKKKNSPTYFGTLFALRLLGPTIGFLLSSLCLQFYEDPFYDPGFGPKDPRWVGAWWLGFIILGLLIFLFSLPMVLFPKRFPGKKLPSSLKSAAKKEEEPKSPLEQLKDMGKAMKRLGKNPILICHYLGGVLRLNGVVGYYVLLPKYMEMQFKQSASKASLYSGPASIIAMQLGILFGGIAIRKLKPRPRIMTGSIVFAESFSVMALIACMIITCPIHQLSGTSSITNPEFNLQNKCNEDCLCTTKTYTPVCGPDGVSTYFSPCYAGCTGYNKTDKEIFTDCSCVHDSNGEITTGDATKGYCDSDCQWLITFVVILSLGKLVSATARVGNALVTLRCVDPEDKSLALGTLSGAFSLLAFIPYPLIYGALTDASCLVWEKSCGRTGNCWIYDTDKFRFLLHGVSAGFVFLGCITDVFVCILSPRLRDLYEDDDDTQKDKNTEKSTDDADQDIIYNGGTLGVMKMGLARNGSICSASGPDKDSTPM